MCVDNAGGGYFVGGEEMLFRCQHMVVRELILYLRYSSKGLRLGCDKWMLESGGVAA